jgi:hypothetical protein
MHTVLSKSLESLHLYQQQWEFKDAFWDSVPSSTSLNWRFELVLHGTKSQKASLIDTTKKASHRTVFFENCFWYVCHEIHSEKIYMREWFYSIIDYTYRGQKHSTAKTKSMCNAHNIISRWKLILNSTDNVLYFQNVITNEQNWLVRRPEV